MPQIKIKCPSCNNSGNVDISDNDLKKVTRGLLAINIASGIICSHSFIVYIDVNLKVRDYFVPDFCVELPEIAIDEKEIQYIIPSKGIVDIDLIKLNLNANLLTYLLKSIFSGRKILLITDNTFLNNHMQKFFEYITQDTFDVDISLISREEYRNNKNKFKKEYIIFERNEIINNLGKIIDLKKLKVEKQIVNRFINETDLGKSYIILKNDINMAYKLSREIMKIVETYDGKKKIGQKELIIMLNDKVEIKISYSYLEFLLDIIKNYFKFDLSIISDYFIPNLGI